MLYKAEKHEVVFRQYVQKRLLFFVENMKQVAAASSGGDKYGKLIGCTWRSADSGYERLLYMVSSSRPAAAGQIGKVLAAIRWNGGDFERTLHGSSDIVRRRRHRLLTTPASSIRTSRFALEPEHYQKMAEVLEKHDHSIRLMNGGNGTMDTCGKLQQACREKGIFVVGVPKTRMTTIYRHYRPCAGIRQRCALCRRGGESDFLRFRKRFRSM